MALQQCRTNRCIRHSVCNNASKQLIFLLHPAAAHCHWTLYCSEVSVILNYSRLSTVVTGCCEYPVASLKKNVYRQVFEILMLFMNLHNAVSVSLSP